MSTSSVIGPGTVVRGGIRGDGDLEILGRVEGSVVVNGEIVIGEGGLVKSDVRGRRVIVRGAVAGSVSADELLILDSSARVVGDLGAPQIGIRPGGLVKGHVSTAGPLPLERPRAQVAAKAAPAPSRVAAPVARPAPPPARPAPSPVRPIAAPVRAAAPAPVIEHEPAVVARPVARSSYAAAAAAAPVPPPPPSQSESPAEPPPPVVPALPKGARAPARNKKSGR